MANFCTQCGEKVVADASFCIHCGHRLTPGSSTSKPLLDAKKERVIGNIQSGGKLKFIFLGGLAIVTIYGLLSFMGSLPSKANPIIDRQPVVNSPLQYSDARRQMRPIEIRVENGKIIIPLDEVQERKFVAFNYDKGGTKIPLLAYISGEGRLVTAVSMCEPCNSTRFHIRGDDLICNSCGTTWELDNLSGVSGSCQKYPPDAIPSEVVGNDIVIDEAIVASWQRRI